MSDTSNRGELLVSPELLHTDDGASGSRQMRHTRPCDEDDETVRAASASCKSVGGYDIGLLRLPARGDAARRSNREVYRRISRSVPSSSSSTEFEFSSLPPDDVVDEEEETSNTLSESGVCSLSLLLLLPPASVDMYNVGSLAIRRVPINYPTESG